MLDSCLELLNDYIESGLNQFGEEIKKKVKTIYGKYELLKMNVRKTVPELFEDYYMFVPVVVMELRDIVEDNQEDIDEECFELYLMLKKQKFSEIDEQVGIIKELVNDFDDELSAVGDHVKDIQFLEDKLKEAERSMDSRVFVQNFSNKFIGGIFNSVNLIRLLTAIKSTNMRSNLKGTIHYVGGNLYIDQDGIPIAQTNEVPFNEEFLVFLEYANTYINNIMQPGHLSEWNNKENLSWLEEPMEDELTFKINGKDVEVIDFEVTLPSDKDKKLIKTKNSGSVSFSWKIKNKEVADYLIKSIKLFELKKKLASIYLGWRSR